MAMPTDVPVIDLMLGLPEGHKKDWYAFMRKGFMDAESPEMEFPAQYMFKDVPKDIDEGVDPIKAVLAEMDHFNIEKAMLGIGGRADVQRGNAHRALAQEVCEHLGVGLSPSTIRRFSNDCLYVQLNANCRERDVFILQPLVPPVQEHLMELLLMLDAARDASATAPTAA